MIHVANNLFKVKFFIYDRDRERPRNPSSPTLPDIWILYHDGSAGSQQIPGIETFTLLAMFHARHTRYPSGSPFGVACMELLALLFNLFQCR